MSKRIELAKSWFQVANEDILTADQLMQYEDPTHFVCGRSTLFRTRK